MEEKEGDWLAATRKRLRTEAEAVREKKAALKAQTKAAREEERIREQERRKLGLRRLKFVLCLVKGAVSEHLTKLEGNDDMCLVDFRSNEISVSIAYLVPAKLTGHFLKNDQVVHMRGANTRIVWTTDGCHVDDEAAEVLLPANFRETCMHYVCAWAFTMGLEYSARDCRHGETITCPFGHARLVDEGENEDSFRWGVIGLRVPLEPTAEHDDE